MFYWQCHVFPILHLFTHSRLFSVWNHHAIERNVSSRGKLMLSLSFNKGKEDNISKREEKGKALPTVSKVSYVRQWVKRHFEKKVSCYVDGNVSSYDGICVTV